MDSSWRFYAAVAKDGSHIRGVQFANSRQMGANLLMQGWTPELMSMYDIKPVTVAVDEEADGAEPACNPPENE